MKHSIYFEHYSIKKNIEKPCSHGKRFAAFFVMESIAIAINLPRDSVAGLQ